MQCVRIVFCFSKSEASSIFAREQSVYRCVAPTKSASIFDADSSLSYSCRGGQPRRMLLGLYQDHGIRSVDFATELKHEPDRVGRQQINKTISLWLRGGLHRSSIHPAHERSGRLR